MVRVEVVDVLLRGAAILDEVRLGVVLVREVCAVVIHAIRAVDTLCAICGAAVLAGPLLAGAAIVVVVEI